jgi:DNA-binding CsgD family transcriptional regulator
MSLRLSTGEQTLLGAALAALVSPLRHGDLEAWCTEVNRTLKHALGADKCSVALIDGGCYVAFADGLDIDEVRKYPGELEEVNRRLRLWERQVRLGIFNRETMLGKDAPLYYRSAYWNEYIVRIRAFDALGATTQLPGPADRHAVATVLLHHESPTGRSFGARGHAMLRLLFPAFKAGIEHWHRLQMLRERLTALLDATGDAMVLVGAGGQVLHRTLALHALVKSEVEVASVVAEARELARPILLLITNSAASPDAHVSSPAARTVRIGSSTYRLHGTLAPLDLPDGPACIVTVERLRAVLPDASVLQSRFGLTRKQVIVAEFLAQGRSNSQIAKALFISPHTARHHTEHVLFKLGLDSRAKVAACLTSGAFSHES